MPEILVALACLTSKGCNETATHYYNSRPDIREIVLTVEHRAKAMVGPLVSDYAIPVAVFASGRPANFKLYKNLSAEISLQAQALIFKKEF